MKSCVDLEGLEARTHFPRLKLFNLNYQKLDLVTLLEKIISSIPMKKIPGANPLLPFPLPAPCQTGANHPLSHTTTVDH